MPKQKLLNALFSIERNYPNQPLTPNSIRRATHFRRTSPYPPPPPQSGLFNKFYSKIKPYTTLICNRKYTVLQNIPTVCAYVRISKLENTLKINIFKLEIMLPVHKLCPNLEVWNWLHMTPPRATKSITINIGR